MYISKISIKNFKCIKGQLNVDFNIPNSTKGSGLNIFVGDNNTGKSTIFEAFDFVRNGTKKETANIKNKQSLDLDCWVEVTFTGDIESVIDNFAQGNKQAILKNSIFEIDSNYYFKIKRAITDDTISSILIWNEESQEYKNETGIDAPLKKIFDLDFIWADTNPDDISKFGATTICGKLLTEICKPFKDAELYKEFQNVHTKVFNDENDGLKSKLKELSREVEKICKSQFGDIGLEFHFEELTIDKFYSNVKIKIDDGVQTNMEEKGGGLQRAVALALLQVYANKIKNNPESSTNKPFYLYIDEPEICLHPQAQSKLIDSLLNLTLNNQIFINTHSPYVVKKSLTGNRNNFQITKRDNNQITVTKGESTRIFGSKSPTYGEINYFAYGLSTIEFHNELYSFLQDKAILENVINYYEDNFDSWLRDKLSTQQTKLWKKIKKDSSSQDFNRTLQTYIRNSIHHPENTFNIDFTDEELKQSINEMLGLI